MTKELLGGGMKGSAGVEAPPVEITQEQSGIGRPFGQTLDDLSIDLEHEIAVPVGDLTAEIDLTYEVTTV